MLVGFRLLYRRKGSSLTMDSCSWILTPGRLNYVCRIRYVSVISQWQSHLTSLQSTPILQN